MILNCKICGLEFSKTQKNQVCCSQRCGWEYQRGRRTVKQSRCKECSREFKPENGKLFCSSSCRDAWESRNRARTFLNDGVLNGIVRRETGANNEKRYFLAVADED